jgi:hypothetical protein
MNEEKIEKLWAVYGGLTGCCNMGYVMKISSGKVYLQAYETQKFDLDEREASKVTTFKTSKELIDYFFNNQILTDDAYSKQDITKILIVQFPKAIKKEKVQSLHDTLVAYQNKRESSQSLPKCTYEKPKRFPPFGETTC